MYHSVSRGTLKEPVLIVPNLQFFSCRGVKESVVKPMRNAFLVILEVSAVTPHDDAVPGVYLTFSIGGFVTLILQ